MRSLRSLLFLAGVFALVSAACGGRSVNKNSARALIAGIQATSVGKDSVTVDSVTQAGSSMVVETQVKTAFRLEKTKGEWKVKEIRIGDREWESLDVLLQALERAKAEKTRASLEAVMDAVGKYRQKYGSLPAFRDYVALSDSLYPAFMDPLIRLDAWQHPLAAYRVGDDTVRLTSAGGDGKTGTADDIEVTRRFH
jgi:Type II secretion system (T2SS), protein G